MSPAIERAISASTKMTASGVSIGSHGAALVGETERTILGVELISHVREGDSLYELLIKQPEF